MQYLKVRPVLCNTCRKLSMSSFVRFEPSAETTTSRGRSVHLGCGMAITAASSTCIHIGYFCSLSTLFVSLSLYPFSPHPSPVFSHFPHEQASPCKLRNRASGKELKIQCSVEIQRSLYAVLEPLMTCCIIQHVSLTTAAPSWCTACCAHMGAAFNICLCTMQHHCHNHITSAA